MTTSKPKFAPGQIVATPGAIAALGEANQTPHELLARHLRGDWGDLDAEDAALNDSALTDGSRLFSSYLLKSGTKVWVITEAEHEGHPHLRRRPVLGMAGKPRPNRRWKATLNRYRPNGVLS